MGSHIVNYGGLLFHAASLRFSLGPICTCTMNRLQFQQAPMLAKVQTCSLHASRAFIHTHSFPKEYFGGALQLTKDESSSKISHVQLTIEPSTKQCIAEKIPADRDEECQLHDLDNCIHKEADSASDFAKRDSNISNKEFERRRKIGQANKGRTPWNKGKKHSKETRELITKRTIEALSDPKVRKKMSEYSHSHSDQSKARISSGLKRLWEKRLKHRRLQENCWIIWAGSIAEAARKGGYDQQELNWDSYEKIKAEIKYQRLKQKAEKVRAREIAKQRAERVSQVRAENTARLAKLRKGCPENPKAKKVEALSRKRSEVEKKKIALSKGIKLKARLTKFHHRKQQLERFVSLQSKKKVESEQLTDKWDIQLIKKERMQRKVSLADQIQALKSRKTESTTKEVPASALCDSYIEEKAGG